MTRLLIRIGLLGLLIVGVIVMMHAIKIWSLQADIERAYTIQDNEDVLFIGSSQMGCSIAEAPRFHNHKIWISDTLSQSFLFRLKELERREKLDKVKVCIVPFHVFSITSQTKKNFQWAWYQELALSYRYLDMLPCGKLEFLYYIACNLRFPFMIHVQDRPPQRPGLAERPPQFRNTFFRSQDSWALSLEKVEGTYDGWELSLLGCYQEMKKICDRHRIRFAVYRAPVLPRFDHLIPQSGQDQVEEWVRRLQAAGIEYVDTPHDIPEKYFFDTIHLIPSGAVWFTEDLYRRLNIPFRDRQ